MSALFRQAAELKEDQDLTLGGGRMAILAGVLVVLWSFAGSIIYGW